MNVLYIFRDPGVPTACKLGRNGGAKGSTVWPCRYRQALSHNPRALEVAAAWTVETEARLVELERQAHTLLSASRRRISSVREWFDLLAEEVIRRVQGPLHVGAPFLSGQSPDVGFYQGLPYDDWRERKDTYRGQVWKRLLWVFGGQFAGEAVKGHPFPLSRHSVLICLHLQSMARFLDWSIRAPALNSGTKRSAVSRQSCRRGYLVGSHGGAPLFWQSKVLPGRLAEPRCFVY